MNEIISINGNEDFLISSLGKYMSATNAELFLANLHKYKNLFEPDEYYSKKQIYKESSQKIMGLIISKTNYYISLKATTISLVCLLLDIKITNGFASFLLAATGLNYVLVRLTQIEKCVIIRAKQLKTKSFTIESILNYVFSTDRCGLCEYFAQNKCCIEREHLQNILDSLVEKGIVTLRNKAYTYII